MITLDRKNFFKSCHSLRGGLRSGGRKPLLFNFHGWLLFSRFFFETVVFRVFGARRRCSTSLYGTGGVVFDAKPTFFSFFFLIIITSSCHDNLLATSRRPRHRECYTVIGKLFFLCSFNSKCLKFFAYFNSPRPFFSLFLFKFGSIKVNEKSCRKSGLDKTFT